MLHHSRLAKGFDSTLPVSTTAAKKTTFRPQKMASTSENPKPPSDGSIRNCPICMDPLLQDEQAKYLSCAHAFHEPCIDRWLVDKTTCPVCRNQELKPPPTPAPSFRHWHNVSILRGGIATTVITTEVLPSAVRPRQQSVHGRRRARRRGAAAPSATGQSRSRSRGARSRSRARPPSAAAAGNSEPPSGSGNDLV